LVFLRVLCASVVKSFLLSFFGCLLMLLESLSPERRRLAEDILSRLAPYEPDRVILFGSFSRNESDELSDVDLVIIKDTDEDFFQRIRRVLQILNLRTAVDILVYTPAEFRAMQEQGNALIQTVLSEGVVLHG
jgi:predicted nucleotidyltransferase